MRSFLYILHSKSTVLLGSFPKGNLVIDQTRRSFYKAVSTPICLDNLQSIDEQKRQLHAHDSIQNTIRGWLSHNMASSIIEYITVSDLDLTNNSFKLSCSIKCVLWVRSHDHHPIKKMKSLVIAFKRKMKLSYYFDKYFQPALLELNGDNSEYIKRAPEMKSLRRHNIA